MEGLWYTKVGQDGSEKGPFDTPTLVLAIRQGHVSERTLVRQEGTDEWSTIRDQPTLTQRPLPNPEATKRAERISELVDRATSRFSWGLLLVHVAVAFMLAVGFAMIVGSSASPSARGALAYASGELFVRLVLPVAAVGSYFYQKRRR